MVDVSVKVFVISGSIFAGIVVVICVLFNVWGSEDSSDDGSAVGVLQEWAESEYLVVLNDKDARVVLDERLSIVDRDGGVQLDAGKSVLVKNVYGDYVRVRLVKDAVGWQLLVDGFESVVPSR